MDTKKINRELSIYFSTRSIKIDHEQVISSLNNIGVTNDDIKAIQMLPLQNRCTITLDNTDVKLKVITKGLDIINRHVQVIDVERTITNITIKDAPVELPDEFLTSCLETYGLVIPGSIKQGFIKGTKIGTGTRYLQMLNVNQIIPNELKLGRFTVRLFCDNGKSACRYCSSTDHPFFKCNEHRRGNTTKRCHKCNSPGHLAKNCKVEGVHSFAQKVVNRANAIDDNGESEPTEYQQNENRIVFQGYNDVLSNFYAVNINCETLDGTSREFRSVEHAYQFQKAEYHGLHKLKESIASAPHAGSAKTKAKVIDPLNQQWLENRVCVLKSMVQKKYDQCEVFRNFIIESGTKQVVEAVAGDFYWGSGLDKRDTLSINEFSGQNVMGRIIMEIREENQAGYNNNLDLTLEEAIKPSILILGDSMFNHVENKDNCMIVAKPGSSLKDTEQLLLGAGGDKVNNVSDVVIALGRNDVESESAETVNDLLDNAVCLVQNALPDVQVHVSSILPKKGEIQTDLKRKHILEHCASMQENNIGFINNEKLFLDKPAMYAEDQSKIHINTDGKMTLVENLSMCVNNFYISKFAKTPLYKRKMSERSTPSPVTSVKERKLTLEQ